MAAVPVVPGHCGLLSGGFAAMVQLLLLSVVVGTLFVKWRFERPQRPRRIWVCDSVKQGVGAGVGHGINIGLALAFAAQGPDDSEGTTSCVWYSINFTVDTFFGVPLAYVLLKASERWLLRGLPPSGAYYDETSGRIDSRVYGLQVITWTGVVICTKTILAIPLVLFHSLLSHVGAEAFRPLDRHPHMELVLVMILWPALCNSLQFYVIDGYLKRAANSPKPRRGTETMPLVAHEADDAVEYTISSPSPAAPVL